MSVGEELKGLVMEHGGVEVMALGYGERQPVVTQRVVLNVLDLEILEMVHAPLKGTQFCVETGEEKSELKIVVRGLQAVLEENDSLNFKKG